MSFKGEPLKSSRILRKRYQGPADWAGVEKIDKAHTDLEKEVFITQIKYQATGEILEQIDPKGHQQVYSYDPLGRLKSLKLQKPGQTDQKSYINDITYNPKGQRLKISYGNGVRTTYRYDKETFRLISLRSVKEHKVFQNIAYFYDPLQTYNQYICFFQSNHDILPRKKDDRLLKSAFEETFPHLLKFFFKEAQEIFDLEKGFEFLNKELHELFSDLEKRGGERFVDMLAKVFLKDLCPP